MRSAVYMFVALVAIAAPALSCPLCAGQTHNDQPAHKTAVYISTGAMIVLPLGMTTALFLWLRKR